MKLIYFQMLHGNWPKHPWPCSVSLHPGSSWVARKLWKHLQKHGILSFFFWKILRFSCILASTELTSFKIFLPSKSAQKKGTSGCMPKGRLMFSCVLIIALHGLIHSEAFRCQAKILCHPSFKLDYNTGTYRMSRSLLPLCFFSKRKKPRGFCVSRRCSSNSFCPSWSPKLGFPRWW